MSALDYATRLKHDEIAAKLAEVTPTQVVVNVESVKSQFPRYTLIRDALHTMDIVGYGRYISIDNF